MRLVLIAACVLLAGGGGVAEGATPDQVEQAIRKAVGYLYSQQKEGHWEAVAARDPSKDHASIRGWQWGGPTAVVTCALLYAGESPQKREVRQAIDFLLRADVRGVYVLGFRCQVWSMVPASEAVRRVALRDAMLLMDANIKDGPARGYFPYYFSEGKPKPSDKDLDHSVSQYGTLGLWACSQLGVEIPTVVWVEIERAWKLHQYEDGGWSYRYRHENPDWSRPTLSMTAAGVASLFITQETVHAMEGLSGAGYFPDEHLERGLRWVGAHFQDFEKHRTYYTLYGIERIGVASGHKYFGKLNWYEHGAEFLVKRQHQDGSFGDGNDNDNYRKVIDTSFALMFLARGRAPVMMNKLQYEVPQVGTRARGPAWCQRPRDAANVSRWLGKQLESPLNWQIVNLSVPVDELHDSPILWIAGKEALSFTAEEQAKLKQFVEQGGLIVGNADVNSRVFSESFRKLGEALFPAYSFRELPAGHVIFTGQQYPRSGWVRSPNLLGLSNGTRELMLLFPQGDPSKYWQMQSFKGGESGALSELMADIFQYAVDKRNLRHKGQTYLITRDEKKKATRTVKLARIQYAGNWDPEPGGWKRFAAWMHNEHGTELAVTTVKLGAGVLNSSFKLAHLTGTEALKLSEGDRAELRKYVQGGGVLLVEAAGGRVEFAASAENELREAFKPAGMSVLPVSHPLYGEAGKPMQLEWRAFVRKTPGKTGRLMLRAMEVGGQPRVLFSPADLSVGLVGQAVDGIDGYERETAMRIMRNVVLWGAGQP